MKAEFLLMNDMHASASNLPEFDKNWREAFDVCRDNGVACIVIGGDVFTAQASQSLPVLMAVSDMFSAGHDAGIAFVVAAGNHDKSAREEKASYSHVFRKYPGVKVVDEYAVLEGTSYRLAVMSYFPESGSFKERLDRLKGALGRLDDVILYIHEGVKGALGGLELDTECDVEWFDGFRKVLCGHYHNRIALDGGRIEYIGSSRQNNFGEDEEKGYTVLFEDGSQEFVKNQVNMRYRTIEAVYGDELSIDDNPMYKTRLQLKCTDAESKAVDKDKLAAMGFSKIEIKTDKIKTAKAGDTSLDQRYDKAGIMQEYKNFCGAKGIEPRLGLEYLDKMS